MFNEVHQVAEYERLEGATMDQKEEDPSDNYAFWCQCFACEQCGGVGEFDDDDGLWVCKTCGGTGIDPAAPEYEGPPPI